MNRVDLMSTAKRASRAVTALHGQVSQGLTSNKAATSMSKYRKRDGVGLGMQSSQSTEKQMNAPYIDSLKHTIFAMGAAESES